MPADDDVDAPGRCVACWPAARVLLPTVPDGGRRVASPPTGDRVLAAHTAGPGLVVALLAGAGVGTAVLLPRTARLRPARPPPGPPPSAAARGTRRSRGPPARRLLPRRRRRPGPGDAAHARGSRAPARSPTRSSPVTGGTTLVLADGTYDGDFTVRGVTATPEAPVVVRAANPGKAVIASGSAIVVKNSAHVVVAGLTFRSGASTLLKLDVVEQRARHPQHLRPRRGAGEESSKWLYIGGADSHHNRVDHNTFRNKTDPGNYLTLDGSPTQVSQHDRIDHNRFARIGPRAENEKEAVRLGWSDISLSSGFTVFEWNLLEECDGDPEVVSVKASDMTIRYNTVRRSQGVMSLRHGDRNSLYGNVVLGEGRPGTGGIRIYGADNRVFNNYVAGTTGSGLRLGPVDRRRRRRTRRRAQQAPPRRQRAGRVQHPRRQRDGHRDRRELPRSRRSTSSWRTTCWPTPATSARSRRPPAGRSRTTRSAPSRPLGLTQVGEAWKLAAGSPEIDKAVGGFDFVTTDFEGLPRSGHEGRRRGRARRLTPGDDAGPDRRRGGVSPRRPAGSHPRFDLPRPPLSVHGNRPPRHRGAAGHARASRWSAGTSRRGPPDRCRTGTARPTTARRSSSGCSPCSCSGRRSRCRCCERSRHGVSR